MESRHEIAEMEIPHLYVRRSKVQGARSEEQRGWRIVNGARA